MTSEHGIPENYWRIVTGTALVVGGSFALLGQALNQPWMLQSALLVSGLICLVGGVWAQSAGFVMAGWILTGFGAGIAAGLGMAQWDFMDRLGIFFVLSGAGFFLVIPSFLRMTGRALWWPVFPASILIALGLCFALTQANGFDVTLYVLSSVAFAFLSVGIHKKWMGFIIPGSLTLFIGIGIFSAWGVNSDVNALARTGIMLVCFAFGWGLISLLSRLFRGALVWWPLIPGALLAVVGYGLFTGGAPGKAAGFIGNTGSVAILAIGLFLLLFRRGFRQ